MIRITLIFAIIVMIIMPGINSSTNAQETIRLWEGKAPGSENWNYEEKVSSFPGKGSIVQNVVDPTMTVYLPDPSTANGAAVIKCHAGAFRMLSLDGTLAE